MICQYMIEYWKWITIKLLLLLQSFFFNYRLWGVFCLIVLYYIFGWVKLIFLSLIGFLKEWNYSISLVEWQKEIFTHLILMISHADLCLKSQVLGKEAFQKQMLEKLIWICSVMLVGARHRGVSVGAVEKDFRSEVNFAIGIFTKFIWLFCQHLLDCKFRRES